MKNNLRDTSLSLSHLAPASAAFSKYLILVMSLFFVRSNLDADRSVSRSETEHQYSLREAFDDDEMVEKKPSKVLDILEMQHYFPRDASPRLVLFEFD